MGWREYREIRVWVMIVAIAACFLAGGLELYRHWSTVVGNLRYLLLK